MDDGFFITTDNHHDPPTKKLPDHDHSDGDHGVHGRADFPSFPMTPGIELDVSNDIYFSFSHNLLQKRKLAFKICDNQNTKTLPEKWNQFGINFYRHINLQIGDPRIIPDVNVYQHKKTLAQGMMDLALLSANANQLRYVLAQENHPYFYFNLIFISASLIIQVATYDNHFERQAVLCSQLHKSFMKFPNHRFYSRY